MDGEPSGVVVVIRFQQRDSSQPLPASDLRAYYRKKTPAQRRRDEKRSRQYRQKGEQRHSETLLPRDAIHEDVAKKSIVVHDLAATSLAPKPADYVTKSTVTFDPSTSNALEVAEAASVSNIDPPPSHSSDTQEDSQSAFSGGEVTEEDLREMIERIFYQPASQPEAGSLNEHTTVVCSGTAEASPSNSTTEI